MTMRIVLLFGCVAAFAQLPPAQAPAPRLDFASKERHAPQPHPKSVARVDATVADLLGHPIAGLTAADFTVQADGKPQIVEGCDYRTDEPLRLVVLIDDLSLKRERLDQARRAVREFVTKRLRAGDEAAILRTGSGAGYLDQFTSDPAVLGAAIDRAHYNPVAEEIDAFAAGTLGALRGVLEGLRELPGRKSVLVISDRLRQSNRESVRAALRLTAMAHRASAVLFAVDMGDSPEQPFVLEQGLSAAARDTGGRFFDGGSVTKALDGIAAQQAGFYLLSLNGESLASDLIAGTPQVSNLVVKVNRNDAVVRARNALVGSTGSHDEWTYRNPERDLERALSVDLVNGGVRAKLTPSITRTSAWQVDGVVHIDAHDITFVKGTDGLYRTTLEAALALFGEDGVAVKDIARTVETTLGEEKFHLFQAHGFDYSMTLGLPRPGAYQLRASVRDAASGRIGSAREFVRAADWTKGQLLMSTLVLRGDAGATELVQDPEESDSVRRFRAGRQVHYTYWLYNVAANADKRSAISVRADVFRDGVIILASNPMPLTFSPSETPERRGATGVIKLSDTVLPGHYLLRVTVSDQLTQRAATQFMDFDVHP